MRGFVRPSVRRSVGPSVRPSVHPSVRPLVRRSVRRSVRNPRVENWKTSVLDAFFGMYVGGGGMGCGWGLDAPAHPSATIL